MMNKQLSAKEAEQCGFVSKCFPDASFQEETQKKIQEMAKLPPKVCACILKCRHYYRVYSCGWASSTKNARMYPCLLPRGACGYGQTLDERPMSKLILQAL